MFELQKPKVKPSRPQQPPPPPPVVAPQPAKIVAKPVEIRPPSPEPVPVRQEKELDWGDDDSMSFDAVSKLMNDAAPPMKLPSPSKPFIQLDTQELEFVTDEQLLKSSRTFHTSPSKEPDQNETINKDEHLNIFWFDAYEDPVAQPGTSE